MAFPSEFFWAIAGLFRSGSFFGRSSGFFGRSSGFFGRSGDFFRGRSGFFGRSSGFGGRSGFGRSGFRSGLRTTASNNEHRSGDQGGNLHGLHTTSLWKELV